MFKRITLGILTACLAVQTLAAEGETVVVDEENPDSLPVLTQIDKALGFSYGTWGGKVKIENGVARLHGIDSQGAAGTNENMSASPDQCPLLRVLIGPENTARILRLVLRDADSNGAVWEYDLTTVERGIPVLIRPIGNVTLASPHSVERKNDEPGVPPDFRRLTQWKLTGDWTPEKLDIDVSVVLLSE